MLSHAILIFFGLYTGLGLLFMPWFLWRGIEKIDSATHGSTLGFRLIIAPACAAFWPWLLVRWWRCDSKLASPDSSNAVKP